MALIVAAGVYLYRRAERSEEAHKAKLERKHAEHQERLDGFARNSIEFFFQQLEVAGQELDARWFEGPAFQSQSI